MNKACIETHGLIANVAGFFSHLLPLPQVSLEMGLDSGGVDDRPGGLAIWL